MSLLTAFCRISINSTLNIVIMESQNNAIHFHHPQKIDNSAAAIKKRRGRKLKLGASLEALKYEEPPPRLSCNSYLKDLSISIINFHSIVNRKYDYIRY